VKTSEFSFDLPEELIAQEPAADREAARLLRLDRATGEVSHDTVGGLARWIEPGTVVVLNDTRVRKARLFARSEGGGEVEFLVLSRRGPAEWEALVSRSRRARAGKRFTFPEGVGATVGEAEGGARTIRFDTPLDEGYFERNGHVPLPPYIRRADTRADSERYQTVYARAVGSAAAPTAGLHLTPRLLEEIRGRGAEVAAVTLHVGLGTFLPIRTENVEDHQMHEEWFTVPPATRELVESALASGRPVMAVGTTVVRCLESAWRDGGLREGEGRTRIFITPGYQFRVVGRLLTNFHTPGSSLLVLVSAFAGRETILRAYAEAVRERYRFFSYGDAMLIQ
jgi:S-adenosylmethionine:tRNA ribosyltransferase-isomerase